MERIDGGKGFHIVGYIMDSKTQTNLQLWTLMADHPTVRGRPHSMQNYLKDSFAPTIWNVDNRTV